MTKPLSITLTSPIFIVFYFYFIFIVLLFQKQELSLTRKFNEIKIEIRC